VISVLRFAKREQSDSFRGIIVLKVDRTKAVLLKMKDTDDDGFVDATPAERIAMVDQLTRNACAFMGMNDADFRVRKDIVKIIRKKR